MVSGDKREVDLGTHTVGERNATATIKENRDVECCLFITCH